MNVPYEKTIGTKRFDLVILVFYPLYQNFSFEMVGTRAMILHMFSLQQDLYMDSKRFDFVILTFVFDILIENVNLVCYIL
jgi:hypothetical protein